jgi:hypothetical protein
MPPMNERQSMANYPRGAPDRRFRAEDDIREALGLEGDVAEGAELPLGDGATLTIDDLSKSSEFDATTVILTGII